MTLGVAAGIAIAAAIAAWAIKALRADGAVAAAAIGTAILWGTGWSGAAALLGFFLTGTAISRLCPDPAAARGEAKGGRRDAGQVLANGAAAAIIALVAHPEPTLALAGTVSALAAANADTWATAVGGTSPTPPRGILSGAELPPGTSGAITSRGTAGAILGAFIVAFLAGVFTADRSLLLIATVTGFTGMVLDSILGATLQGRFTCPSCGTATERALHSCGARTTPTGGWRWLTNDGVNALATATAGVAGLLWAGLIR